jgi:hypothetical protein
VFVIFVTEKPLQGSVNNVNNQSIINQSINEGEQNLNRIKESVRDGSRAYGMAAVAKFHKSVDFANSEDLLKSLHKFRVAKKLRVRGHYPRGRFTIGEVSEEGLVVNGWKNQKSKTNKS